MPYAVVTGATQGMGKVIAEKLLDEGFSLAVCARNPEKLKALESEWNEKYPTASIIIYNADLSNKEDTAAFASTVLANFPEIDLLVNNDGREPVCGLPPHQATTACHEAKARRPYLQHVLHSQPEGLP